MMCYNREDVERVKEEKQVEDWLWRKEEEEEGVA